MEEIKLDVQIRDKVGRRFIGQVRRGGFVPGVVYGGKEKGATSIQIDGRMFEKIMRQHKGQSVLFHLNVMQGEKKLRDYSAILKEEQFEPVKDELIHLDFQRISLEEEIEVKVPIVTVGEAIGVKRDGGSLEHTVWELDIICLPKNIPAKIEVDVSHLEIGKAVHVNELHLPAGVKTKHEPTSVVVMVSAPMKVVEEPVVAPTMEEKIEPEVIKKGKEEKTEEKAEEKGEEKKAAGGGEEKKAVPGKEK